MNLEKALKKVSKKIWDELEPVNGMNVNIHAIREEALSSKALKILYKAKCNNVLRIEMLNSHEEKLRGYDYEICIGSPQKRKFVRFFIQAKRLYGNKLNSRYDAYDKEQTEVLEKYAIQYKGIPLYSLYNHIDVPSSELSKYYNSIDNFKKKNLGVTLATTTKLKSSSQFAAIHDSGILDYYRLPLYRYHPNDLMFYEDNIQVGVPLHTLASFTIEKAEEFNKKYRQNLGKNILSFFFFFFDQDLFGGDEELIPILKMNEEELVEDFKRRAKINALEEGYNPKALIILEEQNLYE